MASENLPEWVQLLAGGLGVLILSVTGRWAWKGNGAGGSSSVEVAGAIVDNRAAQDITETLKAVMIRYQDIEEEKMDLQREEHKIMRDYTNEIRTLHQEIREVTREMIRSGRDSHRN